jgi:hypothetical protein
VNSPLTKITSDECHDCLLAFWPVTVKIQSTFGHSRVGCGVWAASTAMQVGLITICRGNMVVSANS